MRTARADAESLPFADESFDLVLGHAVLHHLPDLRRAFAEFHRVLAPGGRIVFAGEPSRLGDRIASVPKRGANALAPMWRRALRAGALDAGEPSTATATALTTISSGSSTSTPSRPATSPRYARRAGFTDVQVRGEELIANWFGWFNRALEATATPDDVPMLWRRYAFHGYLLLQRLDERVLEPMLPPAIFYNLLLTARSHSLPARVLHSACMPDQLSNDFPLFPLGIVALPGELVPLHIFEERYKTMMNECLDDEQRVRDRVAVRRRAARDRLRVRDRARCSSGWRTAG